MQDLHFREAHAELLPGGRVRLTDTLDPGFASVANSEEEACNALSNLFEARLRIRYIIRVISHTDSSAPKPVKANEELSVMYVLMTRSAGESRDFPVYGSYNLEDVEIRLVALKTVVFENAKAQKLDASAWEERNDGVWVLHTWDPKGVRRERFTHVWIHRCSAPIR